MDENYPPGMDTLVGAHEKTQTLLPPRHGSQSDLFN